MSLVAELSDYLYRSPPDSRDGARLQELLPATHYRRRRSRVLGVEHASSSDQLIIREQHSSLVQHYNPICFYTFPDAIVLGQGAVVTRCGNLIYDSISQEVNQGHPPSGLTQVDGKKKYYVPAVNRELAGRALLIKTTYDRNYGHLLFQCATILVLMQEYLRHNDVSLIVSFGGVPPIQNLQAMLLADFGSTKRVVEHADHDILHVEQLMYVSPLHRSPLAKRPETLAFLRDHFLEKMFAGRRSLSHYVKRHRRLYLARRSYINRTVVNLEEVEKFLYGLGFEPFFPEDHNHTMQVETFASSELIVGVKGAAFANILFCSVHCRVIVLSPAYWPDPFFWDIAGQVAIEYYEIFGKSYDGNRFLIDIDVLKSAIIAY